MLRTAVALRLALLRGAVRGPNGTARVVGLVLGGLFGLGGTAACWLVMALARPHGTVAPDLMALLFGAELLAWVLLPVLTYAADELLDPARLALLPLTGRQLVTLMGVGSLLGIPAVTTLLVSLGLVVGTARGPVSALVAALAALLQAALCVSLSRAITAALSRLLYSRRGRDVGVILVTLVGVLFQVLNVLFQAALHRRPPSARSLHTAAELLHRTPPGLLAAAPGAGLRPAAASLGGVALLVLILLVVWERSVRRSLEGTDLSSAATRHGAGLEPRGLPLPEGRSGAVAAKDLRYLLREPRRAAAVLTAVLIPVLVTATPALAAGGGDLPPELVFAAAGVGLLGNINGLNRFGQDGSASWLLVSTWVRERDARHDLAGGDLAVVLLMAPVVLVVGLGLAALTGGWRWLPAALGLAFGVLFAGVGLSCMTAVYFPFAVPATSNAFAGGGGGRGGTALLASFVSLAGQLALSTPLVAVLVLQVLLHAAWLGAVLLVAGPLYGLAVAAALRLIAADRLATRAPEILEAVTVRG